MARSWKSYGDTAGWIGLILLIAAWVSVFLTPRFSQSRWVIRTFMIAAFLALFSVALAITAARRTSRIVWYLSAGVALISELILFADLFVGD
jgi:hypothetical protein